MTRQRTGDENITFNDMPIGYHLSDYWRWNSSDLLNNTLRGSFCEFVVSSALDIDLSGVNDDWGAYDVTFPHEWQQDGDDRDIIRIEVKSGAYIQAWEQSKPSSISFSIRPTRAWSPATGYEDTVKRQSDVYVFCLFREKDRSRADPLRLEEWDFYVVPTRKLDDVCGPQKTISLPSLLALDPICADYYGIKDAVIQCAESYPPSFCIIFAYHFCAL